MVALIKNFYQFLSTIHLKNNHIYISTVWSYLIVGITELINFKKIIKDWWGFIFFPLNFDYSMNFLRTSECLHG